MTAASASATPTTAAASRRKCGIASSSRSTPPAAPPVAAAWASTSSTTSSRSASAAPSPSTAQRARARRSPSTSPIQRRRPMVDQSPLTVELEGYEAIEPLGESSTATLVRARPEGSTTSVVIKLLKSEYPTPEEVARLTHEHRIVEDLHLDGVVRPLRIERFKHRVGLILEDFGGVSLRSMIGPGGMATETFLRLAIPLAR